MAELSIGQVARRTGLAPSTLRYYEKQGLLTPPARGANRRRYDPRVLGRIGIILIAREAGFSLAQIRAFLQDPVAQATPAARWRQMALQKSRELDELSRRLERNRQVLAASFQCGCRSLADCEKLVASRFPAE
jgi:MerR family redox-sensitive transcriptional activator SoxR